ncbi:MAG: DUF748 domain-containing protein [Azoarcus sp.]|jgi:hypothetical protein|nr:DUF748 domain-containing protein [Azoarcus sp.]
MPAVASSWTRRLVRPFAWSAMALALYAVLGFAAVPWMARHQLPRVLGDWLGRAVSIGKITFNPFTLTVELYGVEVAGTEAAAAPALGFDRLMVNFEIMSFAHGGPVARELALEGPRARLTRLAPGLYDCSDVFERLSRLAGEEGDGGGAVVFSLANVRVENGLIEIDDRVTGATHSISELKLGLPAVSSLPVNVDVHVEPRLSARLDGRPLAAQGSLDLRQDGFKGALEQVSLKGFDLPSWLVYLPFPPTFGLSSGKLDLDMLVKFEQSGGAPPSVSFKGKARIDRLAIQDLAGKSVLEVFELDFELDAKFVIKSMDIHSLIGHCYFSRLRLQRPELNLVRLADGTTNVARLWPASPPEKSAGAARRKGAAKSGTGGAGEKNKPRINFLLSSARIRDGLIRYSDHAVAGGFSTRLEGIDLDMRDLAMNGSVPAEIRLDYVSAAGEKFSHQDRLRLEPFEYDGNVVVNGFQAGLYKRYYSAFLPGGEIRHGRVDGVFRFRVAAAGEDAEGMALLGAGVEKLVLSDFALALAGRKGELLKLGSLAVTSAEILPAAREFRIEEARAHGAALTVLRLPGGRYDFMALFGPPSARAAPPWTFQLGKAAVEGGSLRFEDRAGGGAVAMRADDIELEVSNLSTARGAKEASLVLRGRVDGDGRVEVRGRAAPAPLRADLEIDVQAFALPVLQPYARQWGQFDLRDGRLSARGRLTLRQRREGLSGVLLGDAAINGFAAIDRRDGTELVRWREVAARRARADLAPFALSIDEIAVDGLRSRLILDQDGRLNLREIQRSPQEQASAAREDAPAAGSDGDVLAAPPPSFRVGRVSVKGSSIAFSDRFIRPNYNAALENLSGEFSGLSTNADALVKLDLKGRAGQSAPLMIKGEFSPFRQDRHLDIEATVKDFELTGLSGYSGRYIGHGIDRGKLSATLNYRIEDRKLSAENHLFLDQLVFGDAVDSPEATTLPVRLAVSLLRNARGEIDINLPVSGTLDDPQFSVFGLVLRAFAGLIGKAVTAPFALLGREELSWVDFDPGDARIGAAQEEKLRALARTLAERPELRLDVTGAARAARDADGLRRGKLRALIEAERRKAAADNGAVPAEAPDNEEYAAALARLYNDSGVEKPRNFLGFIKDLPVGEMETRLLASITVDEDDIAALARRREAAVQRWLSGEGAIAPERIFLRAASGHPPQESASESEGGGADGVRFFLR